MNKFLLFIMNLAFCFHCYGNSILNQKDTLMNERYDFELTEGGKKDTSFMRGQTLVDIYGMVSGEGVYKEYAPACDFYMTYKAFYSNGVLKEKGCYYFLSTKFGEWKYYNENGDLIKTVNEDLKFGKITPKDIIDLLEKEGWFNRKTGVNKLLAAPKHILNSDSTYLVIDPPSFRIDGYFTYEINRWMDISFISSSGYPQWLVSIDPTAINGWVWTTYVVDGNTGEFEKKTQTVKPPIE